MRKKENKQQRQRWTTGQEQPLSKTPCRFERQCEKLKLDSENISACAASRALKNWAAEISTKTGSRRYNSYFLPEALLSAWKFVTEYSEYYDPALPKLSFERAA